MEHEPDSGSIGAYKVLDVFGTMRCVICDDSVDLVIMRSRPYPDGVHCVTYVVA